MSRVRIDVSGGSARTRAMIAEAIREMLIDYRIPTESDVESIDGACNHAGSEKPEVALATPAGYPKPWRRL